MPITARCRSSVGNWLGATILLLAVLTGHDQARADAFADGGAAFAAGDYKSAETHWRKAAREGSAEATMHLGLLEDAGLGRPRDAARAFDYYLEAAQQGLPQAAFNVGVMLESGTGVAVDRISAGVWYARAATGGSSRAAYNLGVMYRDGSGVPINVDLAAYWLRTAVPDVPAAEAALKELKDAHTDSLEAPVPLNAGVVLGDGSAFADLVWTAGTGPELSFFVVQTVTPASQDRTPAVLTTSETAGSALRVKIAVEGMLWRVVRVDPVRNTYRASSWQHQLAKTDRPDPKGVVSIYIAEGSFHAAARAADLSRTIDAAGMAVRIVKTTEPVMESMIQYRFTTDAEIAQAVVTLIRGIPSDRVALSEALRAGPGEVVIFLATLPNDRDQSAR